MTNPVTIHVGDVREGLAKIPAGSVQCCVTSPPYWGLRDYGVDGQIGLEDSPDAYVAAMVEVFRGVRRALRDDGVVFLNVGDSYASGTVGRNDTGRNSGGGEFNGGPNWTMKRPCGSKPKDLCMIPWRLALALQADGWWLRSVIVWAKKSPMPESVTDRPTSAWEPIFLLAKQERYFYDHVAVRETGATGEWSAMPPIGGVKHAGSNGNPTYSGDTPASDGTRNQRNVWTLATEAYDGCHFATYPTEIPRRAIKAGTSEKGCCPACRAPYARVVDRKQVNRDRPNDYVKPSGLNGGAYNPPGQAPHSNARNNSCANSVAGVETRTLGWEPTCNCNAGEPVPCLVLDPFLGSGTTIAVARQLGRHGVGCELNPEYVELAKVRIGKAEKPHTFQDTREADAPLFGTLREVGT